MRHFKTVTIFFCWTYLCLGCDNYKNQDKNSDTALARQIVYNKDIDDSSIFRLAILKSITIPYKRTFDTLIINSKWRFLDGFPDDYPINYPETYVDRHPYIDSLSRLLNIKTITDSGFDKYMDNVLQNKFKGTYPKSLFDTCLADNIYVNVVAKRLKDNSTLVIAWYRTVDSIIRVDNRFVRVKNDWTFKKVKIGPIDR